MMEMRECHNSVSGFESAYSVVMMLINVVFSTLSLSSTVDNSIYFKEQFIPSICGILSMIYCLYRLFIRKSPK